MGTTGNSLAFLEFERSGEGGRPSGVADFPDPWTHNSSLDIKLRTPVLRSQACKVGEPIDYMGNGQVWKGQRL